MLAKPPKAERIENGEDQPAFRLQNADGFAKRLLRFGRKIEHMRQRQQVDAVIGNRERFRLGFDEAKFLMISLSFALFKIWSSQPSGADAVVGKRRQPRTANLQRSIAECILYELGVLSAFPRQQELTGRRVKKFFKA